MVLEIGFYPSAFHNLESDTTGKMGGAIDSSAALSASLNSFFPEGVSDYIGQSEKLRFQTLYVKNTGLSTINNPRVFLNNVKHVGQISIFNSLIDSASVTGSTATGSVTGYNGVWSTTADFSEPIGLANASPFTGLGTAITSLAPGAYVGFVIRQKINDNLPTEIGASTTIGIIGEV
jgi:hypothetical protein